MYCYAYIVYHTCEESMIKCTNDGEILKKKMKNLNEICTYRQRHDIKILFKLKCLFLLYRFFVKYVHIETHTYFKF